MSEETQAGVTGNEELARICKGLSPTQLRFVSERPYYDSDKACAEAIGVTPGAVSAWKYKGAQIDRAVHLVAFDGLIISAEILRRALVRAAQVKAEGLDEDDAKLRQDVATEIIERHHGKPAQKVEAQQTVTLMMDR